MTKRLASAPEANTIPLATLVIVANWGRWPWGEPPNRNLPPFRRLTHNAFGRDSRRAAKR